jgi:DHA1 family multidrug resistance protein-like MFS transporter
MGAVSGVNTAAMALIAATTPEKHTGHAIGLLQTGFMAGTFAGPALGAFVAEFVGYRGCFVFAGAVVLLLLPFVMFGVQENFAVAPQAKRGEKSKSARADVWGAGRQRRELFFLFAALFLTQFCLQGSDAFIPLYIKEIYGGDRLNAVSAAAFGVSAGATALVSPRLGKFGDSVGNRRIVQICLLGLGLCVMAQALSGDIRVLLGIRVLSGVFIGGVIPNCYTAISRLAAPATRGSAIGFSGAFSAIGSFGGPLLSGIIVASHGITPLFLVLGALLLCAWLRGITSP